MVKYWRFEKGSAVTRSASLTSTVVYKNPQAALDWLERAFGFEITTLLTDAQGQVAHAEMGFHGVKIGVAGEWFGDVLGPARMKSPANLDGQGTQFCWIDVPDDFDLDAHCRQSEAAGAQITQPPEEQFYGARTYRAIDPDGHVWNFRRHTRDVPVREIEAATGLTYAVAEQTPPPEARSPVSPGVCYADPAAAYRWLERAFGLEPHVYITTPEGELMHAEMTFRGQTIGVAKAWSDRHAAPGDVGGRNTQSVHLQLAEDIDAHHARAMAAGARLVRPLETQSYGDRTYIALDLEGHVWSFGQTVKPMSQAQWEQELDVVAHQRPPEPKA